VLVDVQGLLHPYDHAISIWLTQVIHRDRHSRCRRVSPKTRPAGFKPIEDPVSPKLSPMPPEWTCRADRARRRRSRPGVESRRSRASRAGSRAYRHPAVAAQELVAHGRIRLEDRANHAPCERGRMTPRAGPDRRGAGRRITAIR
jgi:hypothetical protein